MSYGELYIPPERTHRNAKTGRFMPGHVPANKGKPWSEWVSKRAQRRMMKGWKNLDIHRNKNGRPDNAGRCRKQVIAVRDDGSWLCLPFIRAAGEWIGGRSENVRRCCYFNSGGYVRKDGKPNTDHRYKGVRFYYESDDVWLTKIKKQ